MNRVCLAAAFILMAACDDPIRPGARCDVLSLPVSGTGAAPTVVAVILEVQSVGIVVLATATDPQGSENLTGIVQTIGVHRNALCTENPILVSDDLAGSGIEESFGTAVGAAENPSLYSMISGSSSWPVDVDFRDSDGNRTTGRVLAPVRN